MNYENNKYRLTDNTIEYKGHTLYQIQAEKCFTAPNGRNVLKGDLGGWVQSESNLSQENYAWIFDDAMVYENGYVTSYAVVSDQAQVYGAAVISNDAQVYGNAKVGGQYTYVYEYCRIYGNSIVGLSNKQGNKEICTNLIKLGFVPRDDRRNDIGNSIILLSFNEFIKKQDQYGFIYK